MGELRAATEHLRMRDEEPLNLLRHQTLPARWAQLAAERADLRALYAEGAWWTRRDLQIAAEDRATRIRGSGISPGDRILFNCRSSLDLVLDHIAALTAGAVAVPTNPAYTQPEFEYILRDSEPELVLSDDEQKRKWAAAAGVPTAHSLADLPGGATHAMWQGESSDTAMIVYTSGTTGRPKGAVLSHGNLLAGAESLRLAWRWSEADRLVLALPLFHMHGLGVGLHGTLGSGASAVLVPRFSPDAVLDAVRDHEATLFFGVPTMYVRLIEHPRAKGLASLRLCVSGSAPLPTEIYERVQEVTGQAPLERYGMTETVMLTSNPAEGERRAGTVGFPLPGVRVLVAGRDEGEILVAGPNVFSGYWRRPDADQEAFTAEGLFRTGDIGRIDEAGYLAIVGRSKELIISGGYNVYPREVEETLAKCPGVTEVAVSGIPSEEWGETVVAFVVRAEPAVTSERLLAHAAAHLASYKQPRAVAFVEALPRNAMGKIVRGDLPFEQLEATEVR